MISSLSKNLYGPSAPANDGPEAKSAPANDGPEAKSAPPNDGVDAPAGIVSAPSSPGVSIEVTKTAIEYEAGRSERVGYLRIEPGEPPMISPDSDTVLHLLFYLTYTQKGRWLLLEYTFDRDAKEQLPPGATRATLKTKLREKFPSLDDDRLEIALDAHFAAGAYVAALKNNEPSTMPSLQEIYKQKLAAMLGALYDDSMGRDFSCIW
jgi:hypothetical protein